MENKTNPLDFITPDSPSDYPLTTGELVILAERWWDFFIDMDHWWVLANQVGSSELRDVRYAEGRLALLEEALGSEHMDRLQLEALARWRGSYGELLWHSVRAKRPLFEVEAECRSVAEGRLPAYDDQPQETAD